MKFNFIQDNQAKSNFGVLRGLHYQHPPYAQTKLIRAVVGTVLDVVVDIRKSSSTFGKWFSVELSETNHKQLLVPKGFAHGYVVLSDEAIVQYKCDEFYHPESEGGINPFDPNLDIDWQISFEEAVLSGKDKIHPNLAECVNKFE